MIKVLVVDDEVDIANTFVEFLADCRYDTKQAKNADEAFKALEDHNPDILLLDINLREKLTGIDILKKAKQLNPKVLTAIITGLGENNAVDEALSCGANIVLQKPLSALKVVEAVNNLAKDLKK